ncbi:MAG UNVERIFIED_CONTAM: hypothetical protein LVR18_32025 [Planctomycetaceae bacterium]
MLSIFHGNVSKKRSCGCLTPRTFNRPSLAIATHSHGIARRRSSSLTLKFTIEAHRRRR